MFATVGTKVVWSLLKTETGSLMWCGMVHTCCRHGGLSRCPAVEELVVGEVDVVVSVLDVVVDAGAVVVDSVGEVDVLCVLRVLHFFPFFLSSWVSSLSSSSWVSSLAGSL
eukprot:3298323-Amphidinium_carterae.1